MDKKFNEIIEKYTHEPQIRNDVWIFQLKMKIPTTAIERIRDDLKSVIPPGHRVIMLHDCIEYVAPESTAFTNALADIRHQLDKLHESIKAINNE